MRTTLQYMMKVKLWQQRFRPCHAIGLSHSTEYERVDQFPSLQIRMNLDWSQSTVMEPDLKLAWVLEQSS